MTVKKLVALCSNIRKKVLLSQLEIDELQHKSVLLATNQGVLSVAGEKYENSTTKAVDRTVLEEHIGEGHSP